MEKIKAFNLLNYHLDLPAWHDRTNKVVCTTIADFGQLWSESSICAQKIANNKDRSKSNFVL